MFKGSITVKWLALLVGLVAIAGLACSADPEIVEVVKEVVVEKEVVKTIEVPGETITVTQEVVKEVEVEKIVTQEVVKTVQVPGETVTVTKEVVKEVPVETIRVVEVERAAGEKVLRVRFKESPAHFNPFQNDSRSIEWMYNLMGSRLVYPDDNIKGFAPDLAERWEAAPDGSSYTFFLRKGAKFHDGHEVTADDVVYTFTQQLNPNVSRWGNALKVIKGAQDFADGNADTVEGIVKVDDYTVRFDQEFPNALFLWKCCSKGSFVILPEHILGNVTDEDMETHPFHTEAWVGSGPFKFVSFVSDEGMVLEKNPDYFFGQPLIDKITFEYIPSRDTTWVAMQRGEIHVSTYPSATEEMYDGLAKDPRFNVFAVEGLTIRGHGFNHRVEDLKDPRVRQAFMHAIDSQAIVDAFWGGNGVSVNTNLYHPWYRKSEWDDLYKYDPQKARDLLAAAGWDSSREIDVLTYYVDRDDMFAAMQQMLAEVGINVQYTVMQVTPWLDAYFNPSGFDAVFAGQSSGPDPDNMLSATFSLASKNPFGYASEDLEQRILAGRMAATEEERAQIYGEIGDEFVQTLPIMPLFRQNEWFYKSDVFVHPLIDRLPKATGIGDVPVHSVFDRGGWMKYHPEQWDIREE